MTQDIYNAEAAIIGGLMLYPEECLAALESLTANDFENPQAASAFEMFLQAKKQDEPMDSAILVSKLIDVDTQKYAIMAAQTFINTANYDGYIDVVKNTSGKRRVAERLQQILFDGLDYSGMIAEVSKLLDSESVNSKQDDPDFIVDYIVSFDTPPDPSERIQTGFQHLDRALGGLRKGSLSYIGAYPSTGKTSFACNIMRKNLHDKKKVQCFSLEMSKEQILDRLFSAMLEIDYRSIDEKHITEEEQIKLTEFANQIWKLKNLSISDNVYSIETMANKISQFKPDLVVVDFLQNIRATGHFATRKNQIDYISSELKRLARVNNCAIIVLSQLARSNEKPTMSSLKESGNLEADGDYIMLMYRPYVIDKSGKYQPEQTEILLDKNKYGICGKVDMLFRGQFQKFEEIETRYEER